MRITIKLKIIATMAAAFLVAMIVGGFGLWSLKHAQADLSSVQTTQMVPIAQLVKIRKLIFLNRAVLNSALLVNTPAATSAAEASIALNAKEIDKHWAVYYPALASGDDEISHDKLFIAQETRTRDLMTQELSLIKSGKHDNTVSFMVNKVGPSLDEEATLSGKIIDINMDQAKQTSDASLARGHQTMMIMLALLAVAASFLLVSGVALTRSVMKPLLRARELVEKISEGELSHKMVVTGKDEFSDTLRALSRMDDELTSIVVKVRDNAFDVMNSARNISSGNDDLSSRTQEQASSLEETAASMEEMTATVKQNAEGAEQAQTIASSLRDDAVTGRKIAADASAAMDMISDASQSISEIAVLIDEIAFQTNLLALNAAVEAARAGDQGRGFAVVAAEVRSLAQRSASAAKDIKGLINKTVERVNTGAALTRKAGQSLETIQTGATKVYDIVNEIAAASVQQSAGIDQINDAVTSLDQVTQQNAALVEEASAASRQALEQTQELVQQMAFFKIAVDNAVSRHGHGVDKSARPYTRPPVRELRTL